MADANGSDGGQQPSGFPQSPSAFDADERVSFSTLDDKFVLETEEGTEYEWDTALRRWIPVVGLRTFLRDRQIDDKSFASRFFTSLKARTCSDSNAMIALVEYSWIKSSWTNRLRYTGSRE